MGSNKTQVLYRLRLRLFTPTQPMLDVQTTSQERKLDPEVIIKHGELYARSWESECETLVSDNDRDKTVNHNSPKTTVRHDSPNDESCITPGTIQEVSQKFSPRQVDYVTGPIWITT